MITLKTNHEYQLMKRSADILRQTFDMLEKYIEAGKTSLDLDEKAETFIRKKGGIPAFKGYHGFPGTICASINEEVVHGIPSKRVLCDGDIISIDMGVILNGYYSDAARTYPIGNVSEVGRAIINVTRDALYYGLRRIKTGMRLGDLAHNIQSFVEKNGFSVVRDFVGHGIGKELHEDPQVPNFGKAGTGIVLEEGLALAVEPMVNEGSWKVKVLENKWTVATCDQKLSAHYEETIFFHRDGNPEILTA